MDAKLINQNSITSFSIASVVAGVLSLVTCCTGILPLIIGGTGIFFVVLSKRKGIPLSTMSIVGAVLCTVGMVLGLFLTVYTTVTIIIPVMTDPAAYQELNTYYQNLYGVSLDEIFGELRPMQ